MERRWFVDDLGETRCLSCIQEWRAGTEIDRLYDYIVAPLWTTVTTFMPVLGPEGCDGKTLVRRRAMRDYVSFVYPRLASSYIYRQAV